MAESTIILLNILSKKCYICKNPFNMIQKAFFIFTFFAASLCSYSQSSTDYYGEGVSKVISGDYNGAILDFTTGIKTSPFSEDIQNLYYWRAMAKDSIRDFTGAIADYSSAIKIDSFPHYFSSRARAKANMKDYRGAESDLTYAIKFDLLKDNPYFLYYSERAEIRVLLKNFIGAISDYTSLIKAQEAGPMPKIAFVGYYFRGKVKEKSGDIKGAMADYNKTLELNPSFAEGFITRGILKVNTGDTNGACLDWSKAGELGRIDAYSLIQSICK